MVNLSVIHIKDIIKELVKLSAIAVMLMTFTSFFNAQDIIDMLIPGIKQAKLQKEEKNKEIEPIEPLKLALSMEMKVLDSITVRSNVDREDNAEIEVAQNNDEDETNDVQNINNNQQELQQAQTGLSTQVQQSNVPDKFTNSYNGVQIKNETSYQLTEEMLKPDIEINTENILIFHTHTCESYTASEGYNYEQNGTYRTTDLNYSVARVGDELENQLKSYGYNIIHDKTYHDYPAYSGSYGRSLSTVENLLKQTPNTDIVFDIHRDAIADYSYAPTVNIGEDSVAQLMFVIGTDGGGLEHNNWLQNLKFAIKIQEKANQLYPGLFKSIILRNSRYNQHLAKGASIIEVGATGNTMPQCLNSMKYLAKVIDEVCKK